MEELAVRFTQTSGRNITLDLEYQSTYVRAQQRTSAAVQSGLAPAWQQGFNHQSDLGLGKLASFHDSSLIRSLLREALEDRFRWSIDLLPQKDSAKPLTLVAGSSVALFTGRALEEAAGWEWLRFLLERDITAEWSLRTGCVPARRSVAVHPETKAH